MNKAEMFEVFCNYLRSRNVQLSEEDYSKWTKHLIPYSIKKNEFLLHEGEVCNEIAFVVNGCLRQYTIDNKGKEHILQFAPENWWISDVESFNMRRPASCNIEALEDSELLMTSFDAQQRILREMPAATFFFQQLMSNRQAVTQRRLAKSMSSTADERYLDFMKMYGSIAQRVPQHMIASYLGITPESLSRVRRKVAGK
jgi:CRP-like cAMP-binding protein